MLIEDLIIGCKKGNIKSQRQLFDKYINAVYCSIKRYIKIEQDIEIVCSETFRKCFKAIEKFDYLNENAFWSWLNRIAINESLQFIRREKKIVYENEAYIEERESINNEALNNLSVKEIMVLINKLPDGYRIVFNLFAIEGYSHKEISQILGISEQTSKSQYHKARQQLIKNIKSRYYGRV